MNMVRYLLLLCLFTVCSMAQQTQEYIDCNHPPTETSFHQIYPCFVGRRATFVLRSGEEVKGKLRKKDAASCAPGESCELQIKKFWRRRVVLANEISSVTYQTGGTALGTVLGSVTGVVAGYMLVAAVVYTDVHPIVGIPAPLAGGIVVGKGVHGATRKTFVVRISQPRTVAP